MSDDGPQGGIPSDGTIALNPVTAPGGDTMGATDAELTDGTTVQYERVVLVDDSGRLLETSKSSASELVQYVVRLDEDTRHLLRQIRNELRTLNKKRRRK